jgi:transcriptional regulator with GAF, ATPase, and Fis domain
VLARWTAIDEQLMQDFALLERASRRVDGVQPSLRAPLADAQALSMRLCALIELGLQLAAEPNEQRLLRRACRAAQGMCLARGAAIGVLDASHESLRVLTISGLPASLMRRDYAVKQGLLGEMLCDGVAQRVCELDGDPRPLGLPQAHPPVRSFLAVPLPGDRHPSGWLYLANKLGDGGFGEGDEQVALTIAAQVASARRRLES